MPQPLNYLKETASQTAGPYVHIGLIPAMAGFDIFEKSFSNVLVTPNTRGRAHHFGRQGVRRQRLAAA
ncbi:protocatechuate 3,4-dioxygenase beta subunit [Bradyrhizobium sp. GM24.11]